MLDLSPEKILVLGILALVVLGPERLPGAARSLGRIMGQLKNMSSSFQSEVREALHQPGEAVGAALGDLQLPTSGDIRRSVRDAVTSTLAPPEPVATGPAITPSPHGGPGWPGWPASPDDPGLN
ncbi:MAG: twin-arginine translocase TatA/TatE family subunit [Acidimicrobiales bacterium]|nr:twin-arginine translocase TatA/TatE family subunit [Acidimicrobiales bacterium]